MHPWAKSLYNMYSCRELQIMLSISLGLFHLHFKISRFRSCPLIKFSAIFMRARPTIPCFTVHISMFITIPATRSSLSDLACYFVLFWMLHRMLDCHTYLKTDDCDLWALSVWSCALLHKDFEFPFTQWGWKAKSSSQIYPLYFIAIVYHYCGWGFGVGSWVEFLGQSFCTDEV